ncbi:hypothetical protein M4951_01210 [Blastopirellula sp. J2-11]|uniref:hypothetical protein n=1 Tax=Blastopirellula sp. J2-11 TaxID=2943192 RepID=UPI0021C8F449|nr:hypothetical protein [Blastopirellula sp. J2-11]UUO06944.1 hypothetical protein M4951_01210 [Blastopirellula sp. J2-11]
MLGTTGVGWLYSLANQGETNWGDIDSFYASMIEGLTDDGETLDIKSDVWGKIHRKGIRPSPGDGIAFYHSQRAGFPKGDHFKRKPRISLIGAIERIAFDEEDGQRVAWLHFTASRNTLERLRRDPIIRDESTRHLFEACGNVAGAVATMYYADAETWRTIITSQ